MEGGSSERKGLNQRTTLRLSNIWSTFLNNSYNSTLTPIIRDGEQQDYLEEVLFNTLMFSKRGEKNV